MAIVRQQSFGAGELSPSLWSRTEFDKYGAGARKLRNLVVSPWGSAANRAGTRYAAETVASGAGRMIPFVFSETDTLLLVFTDLKLRFYTLSAAGLPGIVLATGAAAYDGGTTYSAGQYVTHDGQTYRALRTTVGDQPDVSVLDWLQVDEYEVVTPYTAAQLPKLRYAQVGDVITICHPDHVPRELKRIDASPLTFTLETLSFDLPAFPADVALYVKYPMPAEALPTYPAKQWVYSVTAICEGADGSRFETKAANVALQAAEPWDVAAHYMSDAYVSFNGHNWKCVSAFLDGVGAQPCAEWAIGTNYVQGDFAWYVDSTYRAKRATVGDQPDVSPLDWLLIDDSYWIDEGAFPAVPSSFAVYATKQQTVFALNNIAGDPGFRIVGWRVYRGRGTLHGYVGELDGTALDFIDTGETPDWTRTPPKGENPFKVLDWEGTLVRTENPSVVAFHEQRRVFARTNERPGTIFFSATNAFSLFDQHSPAVAEDSLTTDLASWRWEEIRSLVSGRVLLALSSSTEWAADGGQEGVAITPLSWATRPRTERGTSWVEPLKVGDDEVLFVPPAGNLIRELSFDGNAGKYDAPDVTLLSKHLFRGRQVVAWDWQEDPWSIIWVVLDDGSFLSLSYFKGEVAAWTRHDTEGFVEDVCCVREGSEDAVYLIVRRIIGGATKRYIERMETRQITDGITCLFLDSALTYDGRNKTASTVTITTADTWDEGGNLTVAYPAGGLFAGHVGRKLRVGLNSKNAGYTVLIDTVAPDGLSATAVALSTVPAEIRATPTASWGWAAGTITGLGHLEGKQVVALADGVVARTTAGAAPLVVAAGAAQLNPTEFPDGALVVHVGLPYTSEFESLDLGPGEGRTRVKAIKGMSIEFEDTLGGWIGEQFEADGSNKRLQELRHRELSDSYDAPGLKTGMLQLPIPSSWNTGGRCVVRQIDPLPMTILAISREVEYGNG